VVVQVQNGIQDCGNGIVQVRRRCEMRRDVIDVEGEKQRRQETQPPPARKRADQWRASLTSTQHFKRYNNKR